MNCTNHFNTEAIYACSCCGEPLCIECTVELNKKAYCKGCLEREVGVRPIAKQPVRGTKKSKFLAFCFGIIPGAGHMYLGLINKGLVLMGIYFTALFAVLFFADTIGIHWAPGFFIPTLSIMCIFYSIFDSLATTNNINAGVPVGDANIIELSLIKDKLLSNKRALGYGLIIVGCIGILNLFSDFINQIFINYFNIGLSLSSLLVPLLLIVLGLYLLRRGASV